MARRALPSLNALRALEAFARHGRMTLAADELCVTHGAVSRQIRSLEATLGVRLVEGPRNRPRVTVEAAQLSASLSQAFNIIERAVPRAEVVGPALRVSSIGTFAMKWLIPRLPDFVQRFPDIDVVISESYRLPDFGPEGVDAAIRIENEPYSSAIAVLPFLPNYVGPVLAPQLAGATWLDLPRLQTRTRVEAWQEWGVLAGVPLGRAPSLHVFEHNSYMLEAALAGLGVAVSPWANVASEVQAGRLVTPAGFIRKPGDHVMLRPAGVVDARVDRLGAWLVEQGAQSAPPPN